VQSSVAALLALTIAVRPELMVEPEEEEITVVEEQPVEDQANMWIVTGVSAGLVALLLAWGTQAWWEDGLEPFTLSNGGGFGRDTYAGGADKVGHAYSTYMLTHAGAALYRALGMSRARAAWYSGIATFLLGNWFELIDGFTDFGFEYGDVIANTVGAALGIVTQLYPELDETIGMRIAYVPSNDFLENDKTVLKWINDYSGMTFYADVKLRGLFRFFGEDPGLARFLLVGVVYGTRDYSPIKRWEERRRSLGVNVGIDFAEVLRWYGDGDEGVDAVARIFDYYAVPFLNVALLKDLDGDDWYLNFGVANRFEAGL
jgi:hypothetical protein